jgi:uncharacterized protein (TIGR03437 family)
LEGIASRQLIDVYTGTSPQIPTDGEALFQQRLLTEFRQMSVGTPFDPMFYPGPVADTLNFPGPPSCDEIIEFMLRVPLDFTPGSEYAYSNFGYCVLGSVVKAAAGTSYESFVRREVFGVAGILAPRLGRTRLRDRLPDEVQYYPVPSQDQVTNSVFRDSRDLVPLQYGGFHLEAMAAHSGWLASAVDLVRFAASLDGAGTTSAILRADSLRTMLARPQLPDWAGSSWWYGFGWAVQPIRDASMASHDGALVGTSSLLARRSDGVVYAAVFNRGWSNAIISDVFNSTREAIESSEIPSHNLFEQFSYPESGYKLAAPSSVVHGATFVDGIVPGSWATFIGSDLATTSRIWRSEDFVGNALPTDLEGVRVVVNDVPAAIYYVSPTQINFQAPSDDLGGPVVIEVWRGDELAYLAEARLRENAPGFFSYAAAETSMAAALHANGTLVGDPKLTEGSRTALPGETIVLFGTGFEPARSGEILTTPQILKSTVEEYVGGQRTEVVYAGLTAAGLFQLNIVVPDVAEGLAEVIVVVGGESSIRGIHIAVGLS